MRRAVLAGCQIFLKGRLVAGYLMEHISSLMNNPAFSALVNAQVFAAVLLSLIVYRLVSPIIDFLNPFIILVGVIYKIKTALLRNSRATGAVCSPSVSGSVMNSPN